MVSPTEDLPFLRLAAPDPAGLVHLARLPEPLPYGLQPRHVLRAIEDVQDLIHQLNVVLYESSYEPLEDLLDRASFSGLISRTITTRLAESRSGSLVVNQFHNGYPDLIPKGRYQNDAVQRGVGLEVKASRSEGSWQAHGPRPGWFIVVQFQLDESPEVARLEREPTRIQAAMLANLSEEDWSWTPARAGRIRSGTASVKPSGRLKLRKGAVWVDPHYQARHDQLSNSLEFSAFRMSLSTLIMERLAGTSEPVNPEQILDRLDLPHGLSETQGLTAIRSALSKLKKEGTITASGPRGYYRATYPPQP